VVLQQVPALVCDNCREYYLDEPTTDQVLRLAAELADRGTDVQMVRFAA
jgi:hypothetical protein